MPNKIGGLSSKPHKSLRKMLDANFPIILNPKRLIYL